MIIGRCTCCEKEFKIEFTFYYASGEGRYSQFLNEIRTLNKVDHFESPRSPSIDITCSTCRGRQPDPTCEKG